MNTSRQRLWGVWAGGTTALVACALLVNFLGLRLAGRPFSPLYASQWAFDWFLWGLAAPGIVWLARRFPVDRQHWAPGVARQLLLGTLVALAQLFVFTVGTRYVLTGDVESQSQTLAAAYGYTLSIWFPYALLIYAVIAVATHVVDAYRREGAQRLEAAELREQLGLAQLGALRMQLHPHFLFNTLNTVSVLLNEGRTEEADRMVVSLGDLLGRSLDTLRQHEIPLSEELEFARAYLGIERQRFSHRLTIEIEADDDAAGAYVPSMILQPLVENAMRHGIERDSSAGRIRIEARRANGAVRLAVRDDGPGLGAGKVSNGRGLGLRNTIRRLERLYGDAASLRIGAAAGRGTLVTVTLPYHARPLLDEDDGRDTEQ